MTKESWVRSAIYFWSFSEDVAIPLPPSSAFWEHHYLAGRFKTPVLPHGQLGTVRPCVCGILPGPFPYSNQLCCFLENFKMREWLRLCSVHISNNTRCHLFGAAGKLLRESFSFCTVESQQVLLPNVSSNNYLVSKQMLIASWYTENKQASSPSSHGSATLSCLVWWEGWEDGCRKPSTLPVMWPVVKGVEVHWRYCCSHHGSSEPIIPSPGASHY